jgi:UDP-glucose 4-epimerase
MAAVKRIVVCGGNGFLGSRICKSAVERGWDVTSIRYVFNISSPRTFRLSSRLYTLIINSNTPFSAAPANQSGPP